MQAAKPNGEGWTKMPAVRGSGSFYFRRDPVTDHRQWFLREPWNGLWIYQDENPRTGEVTARTA